MQCSQASSLESSPVVWRGLMVLAAVALGCSSKSSPPPASATTVDPETGTTVVTTRDRSMEPNPVCNRYCDRVAECWSSVPNVDPMLSPEEGRTQCLGEHDQCRTQTTQVHCCADAADCDKFAVCFAESENSPSACGAVLP